MLRRGLVPAADPGVDCPPPPQASCQRAGNGYETFGDCPPGDVTGGGGIIRGYAFAGLGRLRRVPSLSGQDRVPFDDVGTRLAASLGRAGGACTDADDDGPKSGTGFRYLVRTLAPFPGRWGIDSTGAPRSVTCN